MKLARGRLLRTKIKEAKKLATARLEGIRKFYKKHPEEHFKDATRQIFSNTSLVDIAKIPAIIGIAVLIKRIINTTQEFHDEIVRIQKQPFLIGKGTPFEIAYLLLPEQLREFFVPKDDEKKPRTDLSLEIFEWLISYAFAYIIVEHFGAIMQGLGNIIASLKTIVGGFLGVSVPT